MGRGAVRIEKDGLAEVGDCRLILPLDIPHIASIDVDAGIARVLGDGGAQRGEGRVVLPGAICIEPALDQRLRPGRRIAAGGSILRQPRSGGRPRLPGPQAFHEHAHVEPIRVSVLGNDLVIPLVAAEDQPLAVDLRLERLLEEINFVRHAGNAERSRLAPVARGANTVHAAGGKDHSRRRPTSHRRSARLLSPPVDVPPD